MLKRFTSFLVSTLLITLTLASPAQASPETAEDWGIKASALYRATADLLSAVKDNRKIDLPSDYTADLARFSVIAGRLAVWVDTSGGAKDFGCIYRGMAEEAEVQLDALEMAVTQAQATAALTRLASLLDDAQSIAVATVHAARTGTSAAPSGHCPASTLALDTYLAGSGS